MSPENQVPHFERFVGVAGGGGVRTCLQRNRSHIFNVFFEVAGSGGVRSCLHRDRSHIFNGMSPRETDPTFFLTFFLEWQEVVASVHISRETGPTFFLRFF